MPVIFNDDGFEVSQHVLLCSHPAAGAKWAEHPRQPKLPNRWHKRARPAPGPCTVEGRDQDQSGWCHLLLPVLLLVSQTWRKGKLSAHVGKDHRVESTKWECKVESECETPQENANAAVCGEHHREPQSSPMFSLTGEPGARLLGFGSMDSCLHTEKYKQTIRMYCLSFENLTLTNWLSAYGWGL